MNPRAKAYLRVGCPYSFKFLLFMSEARLLERIDVVRCDPDDEGFEPLKEKLAAALGKPATFPTVEIEPGRFMADSDRLIEHYSRQCDTDPSQLVALSFFKESIFPQLERLHG